MAGWCNWDEISLNVGTSVGRTVLETVWPDVREIARDKAWTGVWVDRLLAGLSDTVLSIKCTESPQLDDDEELQNAVTAGEIYASSQFHQRVTRFETAQDAKNWIMAYVVANPPAGNRPQAAAITAALTNDNDTANLLPNPQGDRPGWATMSFRSYVSWLYHVRATMANATIVAQALIYYVAGLSKMGNLSENWRRGRLQQFRRESKNMDLELNKKALEHTWDMYGVAFPPVPANWGPLFVYLEECCRAKAMTRLFVTAQQSADQGCTVLTMIADAILKCDDFHWERFQNPRVPAEFAIQNEMVIWAREHEEMKANPWMRFSGGTGRSPQMANLGYLAKLLLSRAKGVTSVDSYEGLDSGNVTIQYRPWIERIVGQYVAHLATVPVGEDQAVARPDNVVPLRVRSLTTPSVRPAALRFNRGAGANQPVVDPPQQQERPENLADNGAEVVAENVDVPELNPENDGQNEAEGGAADGNIRLPFRADLGRFNDFFRPPE